MQSKLDSKIVLEKIKRERLFYLRLNSKFKSLRKRLKKPLGMLIPLEHPFSTEYIKELISILKPLKIISVGDRITEYLLKTGIKPNLAIIDMHVEREIKDLGLERYFKNQIELENPAGTISKEAERKIEIAMEKDNSILIVKGEEDLLALSAISVSKTNSLVLYGLPKLGVIAVYCTKNKKKAIDKILSRGSQYGKR